MEAVSHRELRNNSAEVLRRVESGETLLVTNNGRPAAVIGPVGGTPIDDLISQGQARPARSDVATLDRLRSRLENHAAGARTTSVMIQDARGLW